MSKGLGALLDEVRAGRRTVDDVVRVLDEASVDVGFARVDVARAARTGAPEVIFGQGKTPEQIATVARVLLDHGQDVLVTRVDDAGARAVSALAPDARHDPVARTVTVERGARPALGRVAVVAAGTTDLPVAREAAVSLRFFGAVVDEIVDVGVAGLDRLLAVRPRLAADYAAIVVVAGMDGALPSVVTGLVRCPVIAVPTSVGYGAAFDGLAALLGMLNACASGLVVVNIDNGFGAAAAVQRLLASPSPR